jgi:hypothetical protein
MPEATSESPPATPPPAAPPAPDAKTPPAKPEEPKREYVLRWEPDKEFDESALFTKGRVAAKVWISDKTFIALQSLSGEEVDKVNEKVKIGQGMSFSHYNTEITYENLAYAAISINGEPVKGSHEERVAYFKKMAAPILARFAMAYLEFNLHVDDLFAGKGVLDTAKKS